MKNLTIEKDRVTVNFTANQWELYDEPGRDEAAQQLNKALERAVTESPLNRNNVREAVHEVMAGLEDLGAYDTEPRGLLEAALSAIFSSRR